MLQHRDGQTLAETARTDIEKELVGLFYHGDKTGLVHIITIVTTDIHEVHHPIRNAFAIGTHNRIISDSSANLRFFHQ
jgi:hypothetical protein